MTHTAYLHQGARRDAYHVEGSKEVYDDPLLDFHLDEAALERVHCCMAAPSAIMGHGVTDPVTISCLVKLCAGSHTIACCMQAAKMQCLRLQNPHGDERGVV